MKKINLRIKTLFAKYFKPKFRSTLAVMPHPKYILDIGIANNSYKECKAVFPTSIYHGIDYENINFEMSKEDRFFLCNLESNSALANLNPFYDLIIVNHVLEHLTNGHKVFIRLCELLHTGGVLYAEFPSIRTAYERQTGKTYHFHEDPTHKAFYHLEDLANSAMSVGCKIVSCGPVSPPPLKYMVALPRAIYNSIIGKGFKRFLPNEIRKIDHIMVIKN